MFHRQRRRVAQFPRRRRTKEAIRCRRCDMFVSRYFPYQSVATPPQHGAAHQMKIASDTAVCNAEVKRRVKRLTPPISCLLSDVLTASSSAADVHRSDEKSAALRTHRFRPHQRRIWAA